MRAESCSFHPYAHRVLFLGVNNCRSFFVCFEFFFVPTDPQNDRSSHCRTLVFGVFAGFFQPWSGENYRGF